MSAHRKVYLEMDAEELLAIQKIIGARDPNETFDRLMKLPFALQQRADKEGKLFIPDLSQRSEKDHLFLSFQRLD
ncbi:MULTISPECIES: hypothetical protein [Burkholderia cepacia complex]|uniref:hypothetical protein n=1 Tax=Burkholderia cepacia complex TaxID=87882 RepID=UPI0011B2430C|nr:MULTISPECIES: hypothetical protein [Burkholderia cepacia complex]HDR9491941.1 hypothetical protein [Burkholderia stabilis]HDR9524025.1 hypothetical protein [Burkholderia stabilis]HDR9530668.1 hypothetical protein [Burkholderia stabilis]HDR9539398.1 hypothetical protein [Burkholderia stabilis]HDR9547330.1 hypothetical protein [Burkholderia stabilis]